MFNPLIITTLSLQKKALSSEATDVKAVSVSHYTITFKISCFIIIFPQIVVKENVCII